MDVIEQDTGKVENGRQLTSKRGLRTVPASGEQNGQTHSPFLYLHTMRSFQQKLLLQRGEILPLFPTMYTLNLPEPSPSSGADVGSKTELEVGGESPSIVSAGRNQGILGVWKVDRLFKTWRRFTCSMIL